MNMVRVKVNTYPDFRLWRFCRKCKHTPIYWGFTGYKSIKAQNTNIKNSDKIKILLHLFRFSNSSIQKWNWIFSRICDGSEKNIFLFHSKWFTTKYHLIFTGSAIPKFLYIMYRSILIAFYSYYMNRKPGAMLHGSAIQKSFDFIPLFWLKKIFSKNLNKSIDNGIHLCYNELTKARDNAKNQRLKKWGN